MGRVYFGKRVRKMNYFLIIYDVSDDKRRTKLAKTLEGYGKRVQYSAFECWLNNKQYCKFTKDVSRISNAEDNIRIYKLKSAEYEFEIGKNEETSVMFDIYID